MGAHAAHDTSTIGKLQTQIQMDQLKHVLAKLAITPEKLQQLLAKQLEKPQATTESDTLSRQEKIDLDERIRSRVMQRQKLERTLPVDSQRRCSNKTKSNCGYVFSDREIQMLGNAGSTGFNNECGWCHQGLFYNGTQLYAQIKAEEESLLSCTTSG